MTIFENAYDYMTEGSYIDANNLSNLDVSKEYDMHLKNAEQAKKKKGL